MATKKAVVAPIALPDREKEEVTNTYGHSDSGARWENNLHSFDEKWRRNKKTVQMKLIEANRTKCYSCQGAEGMKIHCQECLNLYCHKCLNPKRDLCIFCTSFSPQILPQSTTSSNHEGNYDVNKILYGHPEYYENEDQDEDYNHSPDYEQPEVPQEVLDQWKEDAEKEEQEKNEQKPTDKKSKEEVINREVIMGKCWQQVVNDHNASQSTKHDSNRTKCHLNHQAVLGVSPDMRSLHTNDVQKTENTMVQ